MMNWITSQWAKHRAKRVFKEYPSRIDTFDLGAYGEIRFANWQNPLVLPKVLNESNVNFFCRFIRKGSTALDIGANIGHMTIPMALAAGPEGCVLAFDPNPVVFKILSENASLNKPKTNISAYNVAITDHPDEFYYHSSEASFNNGGISKDAVSRHGAFSLPNKIKGVVLSSFLNEYGTGDLSDISLIKIDTEGYDFNIVKSIIPVIRAARPALISECFGRLPDAVKMDYFRFLDAEGYKLFYFSDFSDEAAEVPILRPEDMLRWKHFDFYALHPE